MPDLEDAEQEIQAHLGFERDVYGRMIGRIVRQVRALTSGYVNLRDRVKALEDAQPPR